MMEIAVDEETQAVVFVCDRLGPALRRRERCLKLAGIVHAVESERRPSGTYYKLCVREDDAVAAHLALQMGGCARSSRLRQPRPDMITALRDFAHTLWEEALLLLARAADRVRATAPRLLGAPRTTATH
jgi:hypothetical protein